MGKVCPPCGAKGLWYYTINYYGGPIRISVSGYRNEILQYGIVSSAFCSQWGLAQAYAFLTNPCRDKTRHIVCSESSLGDPKCRDFVFVPTESDCYCSDDSCRVDCATAPDGFCCIDHAVTNRLLQTLQG